MGADIKLASKKTRRICDGDRLYVIEGYNYDLSSHIPDLTREYIIKIDILFYLNLLIKIDIEDYDINYCNRWLNKWIKWIEQMDEDDSFKFYSDSNDEWLHYMETYKNDGENKDDFRKRFCQEIIE